MSVRVEKVELPGVGVRHDMVTREGRHVGVITYRDGRRELAFYDPADPDRVLMATDLNDEESDTLASLLGHTTLLSQIADLGSGALGLYTEQLILPRDSRYLNGPLGDTKARTKTGASIVAILRGESVIPSPTPSETLLQDDVIVAVGTRHGLDKLEAILAHTDV